MERGGGEGRTKRRKCGRRGSADISSGVNSVINEISQAGMQCFQAKTLWGWGAGAGALSFEPS